MKELITILAFLGGLIASNNQITFNDLAGVNASASVFFNGSTTAPNGVPALPVQ